jgi:hypothetical protein
MFVFLFNTVIYVFLLCLRKNTNIRGKNWGTEHSKGDRTVRAKMATTCTEDVQK